jgi:hypothetical protein
MGQQIVFLTSVDTTSATLSDLGVGIDSSTIRTENGKRYRVFKNGTSASATIAAKRGLEISAYSTTNLVASVIIYTNTTSAAVGITPNLINGVAAAAVPGDHYFWAQVGGIATANGTLATVGLPFKFVATGTVAVAAAADTFDACGTALAVISTADGAVLLNIA